MITIHATLIMIAAALLISEGSVTPHSATSSDYDTRLATVKKLIEEGENLEDKDEAEFPSLK